MTYKLKTTLKRAGAGLASFVLTGGVIAANLVAATAAPVTSFFDIGTLGGTTSDGFSINDAGKVVGRSLTLANKSHAFVWDSTNGISDLGTLPGGDDSRGNDINNIDVIVGSSNAVAAGQRHATIWNAGVPSNIAPSGSSASEALSINDSNQVVGYSTNSANSHTAFFWSQSTGHVTIMNNPSNGECYADSINNAGKVSIHCFGQLYTWQPSDGPNNATHVGSFGGQVISSSINNLGQVAGTVRGTADGSGVYLWDPTSGQADLSTLTAAQGPNSGSSHAFGINDNSEIVGSYQLAPTLECTPNVRHAFVWSATDGFSDVGQDGIATEGYAINNSTQIAGSSNAFVCTGTDPVVTGSSPSSPQTLSRSSAASSTSGGYKASQWDAKIGPAKVSVGNAAIVRGNDTKNRTLQFPVTLSEQARTTVTVNYSILATGGDTAVGNTDFKVKSGTVTFKPSLTTGYTKTGMLVAATVLPRTGITTNQTFRIVLSSPTGGYELGNSTGQGTILPPTANNTVSVGDASVVEGDHGKNSAKVWVTLNQPATGTVSVQLTFSNGSASARSDYKPLATKTVTFNAGQWQKGIALTTLTDMVTEPDETINVTLSSPTGGLTLGRSAGTITILNDD